MDLVYFTNGSRICIYSWKSYEIIQKHLTKKEKDKICIANAEIFIYLNDNSMLRYCNIGTSNGTVETWNVQISKSELPTVRKAEFLNFGWQTWSFRK